MKKKYSLAELPEIAREIIELSRFKIVLFDGEMGVGKTTMIKELVKQLGVSDTVNSPTFSLVNEYHTEDGESVYHFDFYRIKDEEEAMDMGVEEYLYSNCWCLVEWPHKVENLLPLESVTIKITIDPDNYQDQRRTIELKNNE